MRIYRLFFILVFLGHAAQAQDPGPSKRPEWSVSVSSIYRSELDGKDYTNRAGGVLVRIDGKLFVLCDSHVSQGESNLQIRHPSLGLLKAIPGERLANNERDLELIAVETPAGLGSAFEYSEKSRSFSVPAPIEYTDSTIPDFPHLAVGKKLIVPLDRSTINGSPREWVQDFFGKVRFSAFESPTDGLLDLGEEDRTFGHLRSSYDDSQYVLDTGIVPGMSGEPLLSIEAEQLQLIGLVQGYDRNYKKSFFSTEQSIAELVDVFRSGKRGITGPARWKFRGFTYRDYGNGILEINPNVSPSGGATGGDGGGGTGGDGGDPSKRKSARDEELTNWFERFNLAPGLQIQGRSVAGFRITDNRGESFTIYATKSALNFMASLDPKKFDIQELDARTTDWGKLAQKRIQLAQFDQTWRSDTGACYIDLSALEKRRLRIRLPYDTESESGRRTVVEMEFNDELPTFRKFKSNKGVTTSVDLRGLFLTDLDSLREKVRFGPPNTSVNEKIFKTLKTQDRHAFIILATSEAQRDTQYHCYGTRNQDLFKKATLITEVKAKGNQCFQCQEGNTTPDSGMTQKLVDWLKSLTGEIQ